MLSKSAAKMFFLVGTALCSVAFVLLTLDTIAQVPRQTHEEDLTPAVERGKDLWDVSNCMGCHTLFGEGAYYAPELTLVYERRGPEFIRAMLRDPQAMYPGQRRMQQYDFTEEEIDDLVAFFQWCGNVDLNGFPPAPVLAATAAPSAASTGTAPSARDDGRPQVFAQMCVACHAVDGRGGNVGPALDGVGDRYDAEYLDRWLHDPAAVKQGTTMPRLPLSDEQVRDLTTYLSTLRTQEQQR
ncbi:MAG: c-type cytochrome [Myxococcota bacterium]|nr:c-type cytochrome [Myxococcota bacterium]